MNKTTLSIFLGAVALAALPTASQAQVQLLLNGSFEAPPVNPYTPAIPNPGLGVSPTSWTVGGNTSNLVNGPAYGNTSTGASSTTPTLGVDPFDTSGGTQSLDISGAGTVSQTFTAAADGPATIKFDIGRRDNTASAGGSFWTLTGPSGFSLTGPTLDPGVNTTGSTNDWLTRTTVTSMNLVNGGSYTFTVTLDNVDQVDGLSITQVPEPTTLAASGLGLSLLGWVGYKRRRKS